MTEEEIIKWLESLKAEIGKSEHRTLWHYTEVIDMAIETLKAEGAQGVGRYENAMQKLREMPKYINSNTIGKKLEVLNHTKENKNGENK